MRSHRLAPLLVLLLLALPGPLRAEPEAEPLAWEALIPPDWSPPPPDSYAFFSLHDETAPADAAIPPEAPVVEALDGRWVVLEGWLVPLEWDVDRFREFLLVPYFGACIHVPPPPANQIVHLVLEEGLEEEALYDPQRVTGLLRARRVDSELAQAGYAMEQARSEVAQW